MSPWVSGLERGVCPWGLDLKEEAAPRPSQKNVLGLNPMRGDCTRARSWEPVPRLGPQGTQSFEARSGDGTGVPGRGAVGRGNVSPPWDRRKTIRLYRRRTKEEVGPWVFQEGLEISHCIKRPGLSQVAREGP